MAIYEVFSHSLRIKHKTSIFSKTTLFYVITTGLTFIIPLLSVYTQGVWKKLDTYREQPDVSFKHKIVFVLESNKPDELIFWSSYSSLNAQIPSKYKMLVPLIEHMEEDFDRDGKKDELQMTIDIPVSRQEIVSIKLILIFDYKLHSYVDFEMECAAYVPYSSPLPGSSFYLISELIMNQREPLKHAGKDERYNIPVIDETSTNPSSAILEDIFEKYMKRNITTMLHNLYPVWKSGRSPDDSFLIKLIIKYPEQTILYKVGLWQLIKWAIIQYVAFLLIFAYIFYRIKLYVFQKQFLPSIVISPIKKVL